MSPVERQHSFKGLEDSTLVPSSPPLKNIGVPTSNSINMNDGTLGSALDSMEQRVRKGGFEFEFNSPMNPPTTFTSSLARSSDPAMGMSGKVLRSKALIELAIIQSIGAEHTSTGSTVDCNVDAQRSLKQGNVVALRSRGAFLDMKDGLVAVSSRACLDLYATEQWLVVVMVGMDGVAFYSPIQKRFLYMNSTGALAPSQSMAIHSNDRPRAEETFSLKSLVEKKTLHNIYLRKDAQVPMHGRVVTSFEVVQIPGFDL
jgi:hypothetical protein